MQGRNWGGDGYSSKLFFLNHYFVTLCTKNHTSLIFKGLLYYFNYFLVSILVTCLLASRAVLISIVVPISSIRLPLVLPL